MTLRLPYSRLNMPLICVVAVVLVTFGFCGCGESKGSGKTADSGNDTTFYAGDIPIEMVFVQGGTFTMGCTSEQGDDCSSEKWESEYPVHDVTVSSFYIGKYETTEGLWKEIMSEDHPYRGLDSFPVTYIRWDGILEFIRKLNQLTGMEYRLPTEAEWEYAARGGNKSKGYKYSGSNNIDDVAWYGGNTDSLRMGEILWYDWKVKNLSTGEILYSGEPLLYDGSSVRHAKYVHLIGTKQPNELGIHDMSGNVEEWVNDLYGLYTATSKTNPTGRPPLDELSFDMPDGHVVRGGNYLDSAAFCRISARNGYHSSNRYYKPLGFRLALSLNSPKKGKK